jgi:hypothetical protein
MKNGLRMSQAVMEILCPGTESNCRNGDSQPESCLFKDCNISYLGTALSHQQTYHNERQ